MELINCHKTKLDIDRHSKIEERAVLVFSALHKSILLCIIIAYT